MILRGPGAKTDRFESADVRVLDAIGKQGEKMLPGYRYMNVAEDLYEVFGGEIDWFYYMQGVFAFTNELFTTLQLLPQQRAVRRYLRESFNKYLLLGEGYVPWEEVTHPIYGTVEVGGQKKNWGRQPPSFLLEEECHRNMAFTLYHADQMPVVRVQAIEVKTLDGGLRSSYGNRGKRETDPHPCGD